MAEWGSAARKRSWPNDLSLLLLLDFREPIIWTVRSFHDIVSKLCCFTGRIPIKALTTPIVEELIFTSQWRDSYADYVLQETWIVRKNGTEINRHIAFCFYSWSQKFMDPICWQTNEWCQINVSPNWSFSIGNQKLKKQKWKKVIVVSTLIWIRPVLFLWVGLDWRLCGTRSRLSGFRSDKPQYNMCISGSSL